MSEKDLSVFSEETLNEMAMENLEGGGIIEGVNVPKCSSTNNCHGGNCSSGCGGNTEEQDVINE